MTRATRLNTYTPLDAPWDTPMTDDDQTAFAESAVISGADTETQILALLADNPRIFVDNQRLASK